MANALFLQRGFDHGVMLFFDKNSGQLLDLGGFEAHGAENLEHCYKEFGVRATDIWDAHDACSYIAGNGGIVPSDSEDLMETALRMIEAIHQTTRIGTEPDYETPDDGA